MKKLVKFLLRGLCNLFTIFYLGLFITDYSFCYKKPISNIAGFTAILTILLFLVWRIDRKGFSRLFLVRWLRILGNFQDKYLLGLIFLIIFFTLSVLGIARHLSLSSNAWDMGIFDQALWNTLRGDIFFSSIRGLNLLGDHFEPILFLLVPFYAIWPHVFTLIIIQAIFLAGAIWPIYLIARDKLNSRFLIFAFIISFALSKGLRGVGLSDFHPESFIVLSSLLAFYFLIHPRPKTLASKGKPACRQTGMDNGRLSISPLGTPDFSQGGSIKRKNVSFFIMILLLLACKETAVLVVIGLGLWAFIALKRKVLGLLLVILGVSAWIIETKFIIPFFNISGDFPYFFRMPFGVTYKENLAFVLRHPLEFLKFIFMPGKIEYCFRLIAPVGFLPILVPAQYTLIILPLFVVLLASAGLERYYLLSSHYVSHVLPFVYIAAIYGASKGLKRFPKITASFIIVMSLLFYGKTDAYKFKKFINGAKRNQAREKLSYLKQIPQDASVMTNFNLVPHLSQRRYVYDFYPEDPFVFMVDYIILDLSALEYLREDSRQKIPEFIEQAFKNGYQKVFSNNDGSFLIFYNSDRDKRLLRKSPRG